MSKRLPGATVDREYMDVIDRQELRPEVKLELLMEETRMSSGRDPRSGGFCLVGRPSVVLQLMIDLRVTQLSPTFRLQRPIVVGARDGDLVGWWRDVPVVVRSITVDDRLYCIPRGQLPQSKMIDRRQAGVLRLAAHHGELDQVREVNA